MPSRAQAAAEAVRPQTATPSQAAPQNQMTDADEVARLGAELFGRHLFAVEVAGLLLLVALVGAIAVVSRAEAADGDQGRSRR